MQDEFDAIEQAAYDAALARVKEIEQQNKDK